MSVHIAPLDVDVPDIQPDFSAPFFQGFQVIASYILAGAMLAQPMRLRHTRTMTRYGLQRAPAIVDFWQPPRDSAVPTRENVPIENKEEQWRATIFVMDSSQDSAAGLRLEQG